MHRKTHGFTMIELLVTISLIALLLVFLLPGLTTGRRNSAFTQCISNMRMFAIAQQMYAVDHDYNTVHPNWGPATGGWLYDKKRPNGSFYSPSNFSYAERIDLRETGLLYDYLSADADDLYHCPVDEGPFDDTEIFQETGKRLPVRAMTSYTFNGAFVGYGSKTGPYNTIGYDRFKDRDIFMWEALATEESSFGFWNDGANQPNEGLEERHQDGAPVGRIDGSADKLQRSEFLDMAAANVRNDLRCNPDHPRGYR